MTRVQFRQDMETLKGYIIEMGTKSHEAIVDSMQALKMADRELAEKVIQGDDIIDEYELKVEKCVTQLIARQNPTAGDMRLVISCFKIAIDMERMSDLAVDIAKIAKCVDERHVKPFEDIIRMADLCDQMVLQVTSALENLDQNLARSVAAQDDEVDKLFYGIQNELIGMMHEDKAMISNASHLLFVLRYLERFGDHVCNICESIVYITESKREDLN